MSLAGYGVTRQRETLVAGLLRRNWARLRAQTPHQRHCYAVGALVCDVHGIVAHDRLRAAIADEAVTARGLALLAVIRYEKNDGGEWTDGS